MANPNKRKGTSWETDVRTYLRGRGCDVEALRQLGSLDEGDMVVRSVDGARFVIEAKNCKRLEIPRYLNEASTECALYASNRGLENDSVFPIAVVKARGKGVEEGWVIFRLEDFADLLNRKRT
nr:MAG TPA: HOLLIDAY JUNCTION RESOLVASE HOMOLOGOUS RECOMBINATION [Caudoviricetes sp.]